MGFKDGFGKMVGAAKNVLGGGQTARGMGNSMLAQKTVDRAALKAGAKYVDIGTPNQKFNTSGFLPKSSK
jgi:hypothetical protein